MMGFVVPLLEHDEPPRAKNEMRRYLGQTRSESEGCLSLSVRFKLLDES
jgi:hypothetical protein